MFGLAERNNFHGNLTDSVKAVINSHKALSVRILLLTLFLSNGVESSVLISFFGVNLVGRVLNDLSIIMIDVDNDVKGRMILSYNHKNCNHFINYLLSLMNLISKLGENINMLHK